MASSTPVLGIDIAVSSRAAADRPRGTSLTRDAFRRLVRNRLAMAGLIVVVVMCFVAVFAEFLAPYSYTKTN